MTLEIMPEPCLPEEAKAAIWRIFGAGESPMTRRSSYELIAPIIRKYVSSTDSDRSIAAIRGWFESHGDRRWLKSDMHEPVATMILEGIGNTRGKTAIWAVGSIDADVSTRVIRSLWSREQIDLFVESALKILEKLCRSDYVLDASRLGISYSADARIKKDALEREGKLETFRQLDSHGFDLVHRALHTATGNLLALVVELRPEQFESLIERLDHPVMQVRAAHYMVAASRHSDHRATLRWIAHGSCDALIALGLLHTLNTVNRLDDELQLTDHADGDRYIGSPELRPPQEDLDTAASFLDGLVDQLAVLDSPACARWIGELLSVAPYVLHQRGGDEIPSRISQLEKACTALCMRLVRDSWSAELLAELSAGLRHSPLMTWTRHMAAIAWEIRDVEPTRATEIARATFDEHERQIATEIERNHVFLNWHDWHHREWLRGLGIALAMSHEEIDLLDWVRAKCQTLPLSAWDAEENYASFNTAQRAALHWFLIAFQAIQELRELGRPADPPTVRSLAETLWAHCRFAGRHVYGHADASIVAEHAARCAIEYGATGGVWLLQQARDPGLGPRALWALIDQRARKEARDGGTEAKKDEMIAAELVRITSDRFGDGRQFDLESLRYWGLLWLLLGSVDEAERTAMAIVAFPLRANDRAYKILALKLLALVAGKRKFTPMLENTPALLYRQLWPGYTPREEQADRQQIDKMLEQSLSRIL